MRSLRLTNYRFGAGFVSSEVDVELSSEEIDKVIVRAWDNSTDENFKSMVKAVQKDVNHQTAVFWAYRLFLFLSK